MSRIDLTMTKERAIASLLLATTVVSLTFPWPVSLDALLGLGSTPSLTLGGIIPYGTVELLVKLLLVGASVIVLMIEIRNPITAPLFSQATRTIAVDKLEWLRISIYRTVVPLALRLEHRMPNLGREISKSNIDM